MDRVRQSVLSGHFARSDRCFAGCGAIIGPASCNIAHVLSRKAGGEFVPSNLRVTCEYCNKSSGAENLFDYMCRNMLAPPFHDADFANHKYTGEPVAPSVLEPRNIRVVVLARAAPPVGIISAATGCGKTSLAMEVVGWHIRGGIMLWVTEMNVVVQSQFTRSNVLGWKRAGIIPDDTVFLFGGHLKRCAAFPPTCIIACTHACVRKYHGKITDDPRFTGFVIDECHDEINGPVTADIFAAIAPRSRVRIGLTATPRRDSRAAALFGTDGDTARYLLEYSIFEALRDGHVRMPECKFARISGPADATILSVGEAVWRNIWQIIDTSATRKGIIWADTISSAADIYRLIRPRLRDEGVTVLLDSSKLVSGRSDQTSRQFREAARDCVIVACERYRAGVDVRGLSFGIICGRERKGITTIIQCMGRLTRKEDYRATFAEFGISCDTDEYRRNLRARLLDYYGHISRFCEVEFRTSGTAVELRPRGATAPIYFSMLEGIEICELMRFTADEMMAELRERLGIAIDDEYLRGVFAAAGVSTAAEIEACLERATGELGRWWGIMRYLSSGVNWNRILGVSGDFYATAGEARRAVGVLVRTVKFDDTAPLGEIYDRMREEDKKLPPNPVAHYSLRSLREIVNIE